MKARRRHQTAARIYTKTLRSDGRKVFYGDFRVFRRVGGKQEALCAAGEPYATSDVTIAQSVFAERLAWYTARLSQHGTADSAVKRCQFPERLREAFVEHLRRRAESGKRTQSTLEGNEKHALALLRILGDIPLRQITSETLTRYVTLRSAEKNPKTGTVISTRTINNELTTLSSLLKRARNAGMTSTNPFEGWDDRPAPLLLERNFLTRADGCRLLRAAEELDGEAARLLAAGQRVDVPAHRCASGGSPPPVPPYLHDFHAAIVSTLLYTGGRKTEVLGLDVADLDFQHNVVWFRKNKFRSLKRSWCHRSVPMPPALKRRLETHIARLGLQVGAPVFPSPSGHIPLTNPTKLLRRCASRAELTGPPLTAHALRHTFATAMMQTYVTLPDGRLALRSNWDVAKLLGHKNTLLVDTVYAHWLSDQRYYESLDFEPSSVANPKAA